MNKLLILLFIALLISSCKDKNSEIQDRLIKFDSYTKPFKKNNLKATIRIDGEDLTTLYVDVSKEDFYKAIQEAQKITLPEDLVILIESPDEIFIKNEAGENRVANPHKKEAS